MNDLEFRLGITMAGAVSAGAYTAGVLDYLLESLEMWEQLKEAGVEGVPQHKVVIDILGGASAGSLCAVVALLNIRDKEALAGRKWSVGYRAWVEMNDKPNNSTMKQMLFTKENEDYLTSLLNTKPIDDLSDTILTEVQDLIKMEFPDYVNNDLNLVMTLTSLSGVVIKVGFKSNQAANTTGEVISGKETEEFKASHVMHMHKGIAHYVNNPETSNDRLSMNLQSSKDIEVLLNVAKASGAFPIGLKHRHVKGLDANYKKAVIEEEYGSVRDTIEVDLDGLRIEDAQDKSILDKIKDNIFKKKNPDNVEDLNYYVDGGALNNEPIEQVETHLMKVVTDNPNSIRAHILVDPFPGYDYKEYKYEAPSGILSVVVQIIGAVLNQARIKSPASLEHFLENENGVLRGMIFPSRRMNPGGDKVEGMQLATGGFGGFAGFFAQKFRKNDYQLGRNNCKSFLEKYFVIKPKNAREIIGQQSELLSFVENSKGDKVFKVIPDLREEYHDVLSERNIYHDDFNLNEYPSPYPKIKSSNIKDLKVAMNVRLGRLIRNMLFRQVAGFRPIVLLIALFVLCNGFILFYEWMIHGGVALDFTKSTIFILIEIGVLIGIGSLLVEFFTNKLIKTIIEKLKDWDQIED